MASVTGQRNFFTQQSGFPFTPNSPYMLRSHLDARASRLKLPIITHNQAEIHLLRLEFPREWNVEQFIILKCSKLWHCPTHLPVLYTPYHTESRLAAALHLGKRSPVTYASFSMWFRIIIITWTCSGYVAAAAAATLVGGKAICNYRPSHLDGGRPCGWLLLHPFKQIGGGV